jgi:hypothetical protein
MFMISYFEIPKGVLKKIDFTGPDSFGKVIMINKKCTLQSGTSCVVPKIMVV